MNHREASRGKGRLLGAAFSTTMFSIAFLVVAGLLKMLASQIESGRRRRNWTTGGLNTYTFFSAHRATRPWLLIARLPASP
ncbi:hypothetical protein ARTHRO9V_210194 [Arthrobacter sp. 9V]|nr:hypothetical protein ARTHRO9V_210194 [Arthrobacter sp. 9V]